MKLLNTNTRDYHTKISICNIKYYEDKIAPYLWKCIFCSVDLFEVHIYPVLKLYSVLQARDIEPLLGYLPIYKNLFRSSHDNTRYGGTQRRLCCDLCFDRLMEALSTLHREASFNSHTHALTLSKNRRTARCWDMSMKVQSLSYCGLKTEREITITIK